MTQQPYGQQPRHEPYPQYQQHPQGYPPYPQVPQRAVTRQRKRTSHGLHLVLTVCTFGMWGLLVWGPLTLWHRFGPRSRTVTDYR